MICRAIFGALFNPALHKVDGRCQYHGRVTIEGRSYARILMQVKAGGQFGGLLSTLQIETAPEGVMLFALDDGFIQSYELAGPVKVSALVAAAVHAEGGGPGGLSVQGEAGEAGVGRDGPVMGARGDSANTDFPARQSRNQREPPKTPPSA
jgi:hypothetical protein